LEFRILGPLEVLDNGGEISIRGRKLQALLALLLLHAPEVVSRDRLVDELWGDDPPATAAKTLQVHVSRLRRELGDIVVTTGGGYLIRIEPDALDLAQFERLVAEGRTAMAEEQPERASERLRQALALWRGPPLGALADEPFAQIEIGRLEEERLDATEERLEADLALGLHSDVTPELETLVARNPYRERLRALLMLALYRAGRQADALAAYQDTRNTLVQDLGVEPGARLRELHGAILEQDPALEPASTGGEPERRSEQGPPPRRRGWALPALAAAGLGLAALLFAVLSGGDDSSEASPLSDDSHAVAVIDPATNQVTKAASVGAVPGPLAFEPKSRSIWVGNLQDKSVTRIDLDPLRTGRTIAIGERPRGLAAADGAVWVVGVPGTGPYVTARRIDSRFDAARSAVRVQSLPRETRASAAMGAGSLWVAPSFGRVTRLDPEDGRIRGRGIDPVASPSTIAAGAGGLWVGDSTAGVVARVDQRTGIAKAVTVAGHPVDIAVGSGSVWVTLGLEDAVARIDPETGSVRSTTDVGRRPGGIAVGAGAVWVANSGDGTVSRLDPQSGDVTDTIAVGASPQDVVVAAGRVWVSVRPRSRAVEGRNGGTIRIETPEEIDFLDPALAYQPISVGVLQTSCAKLLAYPSEPGPRGTRPVPELAEALPRRSGGGRSYTFTIRRGYRFSPPSGELVTAQSMKYTIERTLHPRMRSFWAVHLSDLAGATAFAQGRAHHISGLVARGNTLTLRLIRPSATLPERVALPAFCAVPLGTPIDPEGLPTVPGAGPYYVDERVLGQQTVLRRNPGYGGSRPSHPDEIRITENAGGKRTLSHVEGGTVDYTPIVESPSTARRLNERYGAGSAAARAGRQRYFVKPMPELDAITFNTSRSPFSSARLRRAVNYAIDRRTLAREGLWNGLPARPTDQYVPPTLQGFRDVRIYPMSPDLARARTLAGPRRRSAVLYTGGFAPHVRMAEIVRANLRRIGIDVEIKNLGDRIFARLDRRDEPFDMALTGWYADYPNPIDFLRQLDGRTIRARGNSDLAYFNDPGYNRRLDAATALLPPAREIALGRLDVHMARTAAPWAAVANDRTHDFFSHRIGCQRWNAIFGLDLGSLCIRSRA
jgi:YVTN family beta-propeller protein